MMENKFTFDEAQVAALLRDEILKCSQNVVEQPSTLPNFSDFELISQSKPKEEVKPYVSPIFSMSEDEILNFVEEFDVKELATLSVAELDHIGKVLGVDPMMLAGG